LSTISFFLKHQNFCCCCCCASVSLSLALSKRSEKTMRRDRQRSEMRTKRSKRRLLFSFSCKKERQSAELIRSREEAGANSNDNNKQQERERKKPELFALRFALSLFFLVVVCCSCSSTRIWAFVKGFPPFSLFFFVLSVSCSTLFAADRQPDRRKKRARAKGLRRPKCIGGGKEITSFALKTRQGKLTHTHTTKQKKLLDKTLLTSSRCLSLRGKTRVKVCAFVCVCVECAV